MIENRKTGGIEPVTNNEWLRRKFAREGYVDWNDGTITGTSDLKELKKLMRVTLWVEDARGRHLLFPDDFPLEEVMSFDLAGNTVVSGLSLWLNGQEICCQRLGWFQTGIAIPSCGGRLELDTTSIQMELVHSSMS